MNLARQYLAATNRSMNDYDGCCLELCNDILDWLDPKTKRRTKILYIEADGFDRLVHHMDSVDSWSYHAVIFVNGVVHDGWLARTLPTPKYLRKMFDNHKLHLTYFLPEKRETWIRQEIWNRKDT